MTSILALNPIVEGTDLDRSLADTGAPQAAMTQHP